MRNLIRCTLTLLVLTWTVTAQAKTKPQSRQQQLNHEVASTARYFKAHKKHLDAGRLRPTTRVWEVGLKAAKIVKGSVDLGLIRATDSRGRNRWSLRVSPGLGAELGIEAGLRLGRFDYQGQRGQKVAKTPLVEGGSSVGMTAIVGGEVVGNRSYYSGGVGVNMGGLEGRLNLRVPLLRTKHKQVRRMEQGLKLVQRAERMLGAGDFNGAERTLHQARGLQQEMRAAKSKR